MERGNSWERQPGESSPAFEAFHLYLTMPEKRSLRKVAEKLSKSETLINRWSSKWGWIKRTEDYDSYLIRQETKEAEKKRKQMLDRQASIAEILQKRGFEALQSLKSEDLKPSDIAKFISVGAELERLSRAERAQMLTRETEEIDLEQEDALSKSLRELAENGLESD